MPRSPALASRRGIGEYPRRTSNIVYGFLGISTPHHARSGCRSAPPDRPGLPGTSAHIVRLFLAVSWDHDDAPGFVVSLLAGSCSIPLLAPCFAACSSLVILSSDDRQHDSGSRPLLSVAHAACQGKRSVCMCQGQEKYPYSLSAFTNTRHSLS